MTANEILLEASLERGRLRIVRFLCGQYGQRMCLASDITVEGETYLASIVHNPKAIPVAELRAKLSYQVPGVLQLHNLTQFDPSLDEEANIFLEQRWVMIERLPRDVSWLPDLASTSLGVARAIKLGLSVGALLLQSAERGILHSGIRPEYIWATLAGRQPVAVGITTRPADLFSHMHRNSVGHIFTSFYAPLDAERADGGVATLSFPLATMIAEWAMGRRPFPSAWWGNPGPDIADRVHPELEVPLPLQRLLHRGLTKDVAQRLPLPAFLDELRALTPAQLGA